MFSFVSILRMSVLQIRPFEAFKILQQDKNSVLIDVRTKQELDSVGLVDFASFAELENCLMIPWRLLPKMDYNPAFEKDFLEQLKQVGADEKTKLFFICKVGGRSFEAASFATNLGFENCFNIEGGFEDWRCQDLPWKVNKVEN